MRPLLVVAALLATAPLACDSTAPEALPGERFGQIQVRVRNRLWIGEFGPDSVLGHYDHVIGRLTMYASRRDQYGRHQNLTISLCTKPGQSAYRFAALSRGPYGLDAIALGARGSWYEPISPRPQPQEFITHWTLVSSGHPRDSIVFEALQPWYVRGSFRFHAATFDGNEEVLLEGRFFGRVERRPGSCPSGQG